MNKLLSKEEILKLPLIEDIVNPLANHIYFLVEGDEIVYVGVTQNIFVRMVGHSKKKYNKVFLMETKNKNEDLEGEYIFELSPKYNKTLRSKNIISVASISSFSGINNFSVNAKSIYGKLYIKRSDLEKQNISMVRVKKGRINKYTLKQN